MKECYYCEFPIVGLSFKYKKRNACPDCYYLKMTFDEDNKTLALAKAKRDAQRIKGTKIKGMKV